MNDSQDDPKLREMFARLREEEAGRVPPFRETLTTAETKRLPPRRWRLVGAAAAVMAMIALGTLVVTSGDRTTRAVRDTAAAIGVNLWTNSWTAPTDFLLATPGSDLLSTIPSLGSPDDWTSVRPTTIRNERTPS